jgi:hypothetical protein
MFILKFLKSERKLVALLLVVLAIEVGLLLVWGVINHKAERAESEASGRALINKILELREEQEWKEHQALLRETEILNQRLERVEEKLREMGRQRRELDSDTWRRLVQHQNDIQFPHLNGLQTDPGKWDSFPPGHPYGPRVDSDVIIKSPRPLSGEPFLEMNRDLLLMLEQSGVERRNSGDD